MALRAVVDHPKFKRLKMLLGFNMREVLGTLEGLWHFCGRFTPQGDIGKYPDEEIEAWLEWPGEPGALVSALVQARWLDVSEEHRLVVHDWWDHADDFTHTTVAKRKVKFATGEMPRLSKNAFNGGARSRIKAEYAKGDDVPSIPEPDPESDPDPVPEAENITPLSSPRGEKRPSASLLEHLPSAFRTEALRVAWAEFQHHRNSLPLVSAYRPSSCKHLAKRLIQRNYRPPDVVRLLRHCIASGWKGIPVDFLDKFEIANPPNLEDDELRGGLNPGQIAESLQ